MTGVSGGGGNEHQLEYATDNLNKGWGFVLLFFVLVSSLRQDFFV